MIDFRYHVVSIIAVFLALTVGLVIGASVINQDSVALLQKEYNDANNAKLSAQQQLRDLQGSASLQEQYIAATAPTLTSEQLVNDDVVVVQIAGANSGAVTGTDELIGKAAGAIVGVDLTINTSFTDPATLPTLNLLVQECTPTSGTAISGTGAVAAMQLLAAAIFASTQATEQPTGNPSASASATPSSSSAGCGTKPGSMNPSWAVTILNAYQGQGVITLNGGPSPTAGKPLAAFIAAPDAADTTAQNPDYLALAESLRADGVPAVVGGTANTAATGGLIAAVLADTNAAKSVYTVDDTDQTWGQVAVVFAMYHMVQDQDANAGHYGLVGSNDGLLPPLPQGASG